MASGMSIPNIDKAPETDIKIIRRKLNSFVGFANLPKQWHRKSVRRGFSLNFMVVGESGLGKTTLVNTLFNREVLKKPAEPEEDEEAVENPTGEIPVKIETTKAEIEEDGVKLNLNIITAPGFGDSLNNTESWKPIVDEIDQRFDRYLEAESRVNRSQVPDERIHALLYFVEPTAHSLRSLDIELMKAVHQKVNLIPVIAKSDTLVDEEIYGFKQRILADIQHQQISVFEPSVFENDDEETVTNSKALLASYPFAVVGSMNEVTTPDGRTVRGRSYPWGTIEVDNGDHNDFVRLRQLLIRSNLEELKESTSDKLYENYRSDKLLKMGIEQDHTVFKEFDPMTKQEEERALHEAKLAKMEAEMKAVFQQKVSEKEKKLQRSEADLFARHKEMKEKLLKQIKLLEDKKTQLEKQKSLPQEPPVSSTPQKTRKGFLR
ncbi:cell division control protein 3 [Candidozyma haemuli]|uniref:Cell division control protein 3 n=1 Tax=Candidozyma haemuli TaxID=45357 RepID=A0A2V1AMR5_9ASCO|nr:cell division control protein 3 [[Candida] haemuloni]PVH19567.1 cell division control protein 3 [[Candida] haemuloni]